MLLIDADSIVHSACAVTHRTWYTLMDPLGHPALITSHKSELINFKTTLEDPDLYKLETEIEYDPINYTYHLIDTQLQSIITKFPKHEHIVFISDTSCNWRKMLDKDYKAHRPELSYKDSLPLAYDYIKDKWKAVYEKCMEADDLLPRYGDIELDKQKDDPKRLSPIYCNIDKDLDQLPGKHYNYKTKETYVVTEREAYAKFLELLMCGDSADNIIGLKGIGPKKARLFIGENIDNPNIEDMIGFIYLLLDNPNFKLNKRLIRL